MWNVQRRLVGSQSKNLCRPDFCKVRFSKKSWRKNFAKNIFDKYIFWKVWLGQKWRDRFQGIICFSLQFHFLRNSPDRSMRPSNNQEKCNCSFRVNYFLPGVHVGNQHGRVWQSRRKTSLGVQDVRQGWLRLVSFQECRMSQHTWILFLSFLSKYQTDPQERWMWTKWWKSFATFTRWREFQR